MMTKRNISTSFWIATALIFGAYFYAIDAYGLKVVGKFERNKTGQAVFDLIDQDRSQVHIRHDWEGPSSVKLRSTRTGSDQHKNIVTCNCTSNFVAVIEVEITTPDPLIIEILQLGCPTNQKPPTYQV